jgi:hypothetical protein
MKLWGMRRGMVGNHRELKRKKGTPRAPLRMKRGRNAEDQGFRRRESQALISAVFGDFSAVDCVVIRGET